MTIEDIINKRGIEEILHFTTNRGLTGILDRKVVKPRKRLPKEKRLEHIVLYNCPDRSRDRGWHDYVNLSITMVNLRLFGISKGKWHHEKDNWWCVLSFLPVILTHPGVYFCTTNNMYSGVKRAQGPQGLENLFASTIVRWDREVVKRSSSTPPNQPTCNQAEVLYPGELSLEYLGHVYVETGDNASAVESMFEVFQGLPDVDCITRPELFQ